MVKLRETHTCMQTSFIAAAGNPKKTFYKSRLDFRMDLTRGCLNLTCLIQNTFSFPVLLTENHSKFPKFQVNPKYLHLAFPEYINHSKHLPAKLPWWFFTHNLFLLIVFGLARVSVLLSRWKQNPDFEQLGYNALLATICGIAKSAYSYS